MVDTRKASRRPLHFDSLDAALREAESLADAERNGTLRSTGNWALGQAIGHLAFWANTPFDGYPEMRQPPWLLRAALKLFKKRFLQSGLPTGARIPGVPAGTFGVDPMPTDEAIAKLRAAFGRLDAKAPTVQNPIFGQMSHEDWKNLNLRHAELHMSFFHPS